MLFKIKNWGLAENESLCSEEDTKKLNLFGLFLVKWLSRVYQKKLRTLFPCSSCVCSFSPVWPINRAIPRSAHLFLYRSRCILSLNAALPVKAGRQSSCQFRVTLPSHAWAQSNLLWWKDKETLIEILPRGGLAGLLFHMGGGQVIFQFSRGARCVWPIVYENERHKGAAELIWTHMARVTLQMNEGF